MENYKNILVVVDPTTDDQKALKRAHHIASLTGGDLTVFLSIFDFSYEMTTMLSSEEREAMRNSVINDRTDWINNLIKKSIYGAEENITVKVVWHNRPYEAIIGEVIENNFDLIVKATHEHDLLKSVIFTPTDWHLLRKSPVPVLLVKEHSWPKDGNILAAINVGSEDEAHISLNNKITQAAVDLSKVLEANTHLVNSYPGTPVNIAIEIPEFNVNEYADSMKKHHEESMHAHAENFGVDTANTHVVEGLPEDIIRRVSKQIDAELVILGTVGRTGISAALIGNTAEHVIDSLNCDVLALKPDGYESPLAN